MRRLFAPSRWIAPGGGQAMRAMLLRALGPMRGDAAPLEPANWPDPTPGPGQILIRVRACGVCHTELDEIEGRTPPPRLPIIPGHQVVGQVAGLGTGVGGFAIGDRVGAAWIFSACGSCPFCDRGEENLCDQYRATGRDAHGGYAEWMTIPAAFAHAIPEVFTDAEAAPLLCAGAIGFRSLRLTGIENGQRLGLTGFGASAHLVLKLVRHRFPRTPVFVFARSPSQRDHARGLGAVWAGDSGEAAPEPLHAIIDTTPAWAPVVHALANLERGGRLVINAIRKEDADKEALLSIDYPKHLWLEKEIQSVANVTRADVRDFLRLAAEVPLRAEVQEYPLEEANRALLELKAGNLRGAKVLRID
jgi:propanol-preferring alcohol dehydrogenase